MCLSIDNIHIICVFVLCNLCTCFVCMVLVYYSNERRRIMPIRYKMDILEALRAAGYTTYKLRQDKIIGERVIQQLRQGEIVSWKTIDTICSLLKCQPGDIVEHFSDNTEV